MAEWITAIAALIAALATVAYLVATISIFRQTRRSADAAEKSAASAHKSAEAAQRGVDLAVQQFAEQLGQGARIVLDAIHAAQGLVDYWLKKAANIAPPPYANPDPSDLHSPELIPAIEHARRFSPECATQLVDANINIKNAKSELEAAYAAAKRQTFPPPLNQALDYLKTAHGLLARAELIVHRHLNPAQ
ncbi:MAG TPA: hypothetical protein VEJ67_15065 [Candidatus Cybelea sp.]|nr:hypothetical protein [Candidatus Cybelea sp.]